MKTLAVGHPYYANEGCFFKDGYHTVHDSWADFIAEMGDADEDLNLVYRWDWRKPDPDDGPEAADGDRLSIYYVAQRKAFTYSHEVAVTEADMPAVRRWLTSKWEHMKRLWAPLP